MEHSNHHHRDSRHRRGPRFEGRGPFAEDAFGHDGPEGRRGRGPRGENREPGRGPGFEERGPGFEGHGPGFEGRGPGFDGRGVRAERRGRRGPDGSRGRARRGDVRIALLLLLAEQPMHGYQLMEAMAERTNGIWRPSPGAVYPTIAQLEDEELVRTEAEGGRKLVTLTETGSALVEEQRTAWGDPFAELAGHDSGPDLRESLHALNAAARQVSVTGSRAQLEQAADVLSQARRSLYLLLAGEEKADS